MRTAGKAKLFLDAACAQETASVCIERIVSKPAGMEAVRYAVRADLTPSFIQSSTLKFIEYLCDPSIKALANGQLLQGILLVIIEPPTVWRAVVALFLSHKLPEDCLKPFGWLVGEVMSLPSTVDLDLAEDFRAVVTDGHLLRSSTHETREFGYKIKHLLELKTSPHPTTGSYGPGGRHDNDFDDYRQIRIFPTTDEFLSTATPFYRKLSEVFEIDEKTRAVVYLDNQVRLLREDMLVEVREDTQVAMGKKKGSRKNLTLRNLWPVAIGHGDEERGRTCVIEVACYTGLEVLTKTNKHFRVGFLKDNASFLRNDSFGVLCRDQTIVGFAFVERNVDLLVKDPPVISLRFTDSISFEKALLALKTPDNLKFILVDTSVFAYKPVLEALQAIVELPLAADILRLNQSKGDFTPTNGVNKLVAILRKAAAPDGTTALGSKICLDKSQADSLINALTTATTQIQGPPGKLSHNVQVFCVSPLLTFRNRHRQVFHRRADL